MLEKTATVKRLLIFLALGYKSEFIKDYFLNYSEAVSNDFTMSNSGKSIKLVQSDIKDWSITFVDTGYSTNIGQRLVAVKDYLKNDESEIINLYQEANDHKGLNIRGIDFHIGSQITSLEPFLDALSKVIGIIKELKSLKIELEHIDIGGGLGISYDKKPIVSKEDFSKEILKLVEPLDLKLLIEPGRSIVGDAGILVTKVINTKKSPSKNFLIVDAGMNDLIRPPLYSAYHAIKEVSQTKNKKILSDVVGPVCETADFLGKDRMLSVKQGDYLCVENVGAYGFVLSSNYNTRPKIDEYLAKDTDIKKIRIRDTIEQILENEKKCLV